jgi:hypothetical protein
MDVHFGFSWTGFVVFLLPMVINIFYAVFPPIGEDKEAFKNRKYPVLEGIEQVSRIAYAVLICILVSNRPLDYKNPLMYVAAAFLVFYHIVWIRYFIGGRKVALLGESFLMISQPLAVFPVLYFLFAALWMNNPIAALVIVVFGVAHNIITYRNLQAVE